MKKDLLKVRADLMYAMEQKSKTLLGFAINDLDTFLYKNSEALNIDSVVLPTDKEGTLPDRKFKKWNISKGDGDAIQDAV